MRKPGHITLMEVILVAYQLNLELPDEVYESLTKTAMAVGQSLDDWILARLRALSQRPVLSEHEQEVAMAELMSFAGCVNSGELNAAANERIDEDLVRIYGNMHMEKT